MINSRHADIHFEDRCYTCTTVLPSVCELPCLAASPVLTIGVVRSFWGGGGLANGKLRRLRSAGSVMHTSGLV